MNIDGTAFPFDDSYDTVIVQGLTKREYAAIHLRVPDSGDPAIDAMIRRARRWELSSRTDGELKALEAADELIAAEGGAP